MSKVKNRELRQIKFEGQLVQAAQGLVDRLLACTERCRPALEACLGKEGGRLCVNATRALMELSSRLLHDPPSSRFSTEAVMQDFERRGSRMVIDLMQDDLVERAVLHQQPPLAATMLTAVVYLLEQEGLGLDEAVGRVLDSILLVCGKSEYLADYILCFFEEQQTYNDEATVYNILLSAVQGDLEDDGKLSPC